MIFFLSFFFIKNPKNRNYLLYHDKAFHDLKTLLKVVECDSAKICGSPKKFPCLTIVKYEYLLAMGII